MYSCSNRSHAHKENISYTMISFLDKPGFRRQNTHKQNYTCTQTHLVTPSNEWSCSPVRFGFPILKTTYNTYNCECLYT